MTLPSFKRAKVRSIVRLSADSGLVTIYKRKRGKETKVSKGNRRANRLMGQLAKANKAASDDYLRRFEASRSNKKDGAFRDAPKNHAKAFRKGNKKLKAFRLF